MNDSMSFKQLDKIFISQKEVIVTELLTLSKISIKNGKIEGFGNWSSRPNRNCIHTTRFFNLLYFSYFLELFGFFLSFLVNFYLLFK